MHRENRLTGMLAAVWLCVFVLATNAVSAAEIEEGLLAAGTEHETRYYVQRAEVPGPMVLVIGGIHGNEPAGVHAVEVVRTWPVERGTLITVPQANATALAAGTRRIPGCPKGHGNLNRLFPHPDAQSVPETLSHPLTDALWQLLEDRSPDWLIDCHEGFDFHQINPKSVGSTVIADNDPTTQQLAKRAIERVNRNIDDPQKRFIQRGPPIPGSLARAVSEHLGIRSMILVTTRKSQRIPFRARQHRQMLCTLLNELEMLAPDITPATLVTELCPSETIHVGLYDDVGVGGQGRKRIEAQLASWPQMRTVRFDGHDVRAGSCDAFDVLVFSGGSGGGQATSLGDEGRQRVIQFVENGGTYIGICAGGYLASSGRPQYGLGLVNLQTRSSLWRRGKGNVAVEITPTGSDVLASTPPGQVPIRYVNGPIWEPAGDADLPEVEVLGWYRTELAENDTPPGIMVDSPALVRSQVGQGTAFAFSCHPEQTDGCEHFVLQTILSARGAEAGLD